MLNPFFVLNIRDVLIHAGMTPEGASRHEGQSMRAGGEILAAGVLGLSPHEICHLAGVKIANWLTWYSRHHLASRLRTSRAVGL